MCACLDSAMLNESDADFSLRTKCWRALPPNSEPDPSSIPLEHFRRASDKFSTGCLDTLIKCPPKTTGHLMVRPNDRQGGAGRILAFYLRAIPATIAEHPIDRIEELMLW